MSGLFADSWVSGKICQIAEVVADLEEAVERYWKTLGRCNTRSCSPSPARGPTGISWHACMDTEERFGVIWELGNQGRIRPPQKRYPE